MFPRDFGNDLEEVKRHLRKVAYVQDIWSISRRVFDEGNTPSEVVERPGWVGIQGVIFVRHGRNGREYPWVPRVMEAAGQK